MVMYIYVCIGSFVLKSYGFICWKLTIETLEQGLKYIQGYQ